MRCIELTSSQAISIHGWLHPTRILCWNNIRSNANITLSKLLSVGVSDRDLHYIQPNVSEWIAQKGVDFSNVPQMLRWPLHPIDDLGADLSDIMMGMYEADVLLQLHVNYDYLVSLKMGWGHMPLFHYTLKDWVSLGFSRKHTTTLSVEECRVIFGLERPLLHDAIEVLQKSLQ
jgi:hypothetical protein